MDPSVIWADREFIGRTSFVWIAWYIVAENGMFVKISMRGKAAWEAV